MKHDFLLKLHRVKDGKASEGSHQLSQNIELIFDSSLPHSIEETDTYFYCRIGFLNCFSDESEAEFDRQIAKQLSNAEHSAPALNRGYINVFFFDKKTQKSQFYCDRIGIHKTYFECHDGAVLISNNLSHFDFNSIEAVDNNWLTEVVNFKICAGSHTANPNVRQMPAGQYVSFDKNLACSGNHVYWETKDRGEQSELSIEDATSKSYQLLANHLASSGIKNKRVAVLLSGGVDSSLLAALTKEQNTDVVAITPVFMTGENPEREAAQLMAQAIDIKHEIVEISDQEIGDEFSSVVDFIKQPIRSPQTIIFSILMKKFEGRFDAVVFGEGADMIFGYHAVALASKRYEKYRKVAFLKPFSGLLRSLSSIPQVKKLAELVDETVASQVLASWAIEYPDTLKKQLPNMEAQGNDMEIIKQLKLLDYDAKNLDCHGIENLVRKFIIHESCLYHFYTMGALANRNGIQLVSPFFDTDVVEFASNFDNRLYFGDEFTKPILRRIGAQFYDKALIYAKKKGFPTPHEIWLNGPLKDKSESARQYILERFGKEASQNSEFVWVVMAFDELGVRDKF